VYAPDSVTEQPPFGGLVVALFGPTASGKSAVAEELARRLPTAIVSADAMQAYRGLPILTNQPAFPTELVGVWPLDTEGSVGRYAPLAHAAIDATLARGRTPIVVGGTGLYLRAALGDLELPPPPDPGARERLERLYERVGAERAHALLAERDPAAAAAVHPNDRRRVIRALELADTGRTLRPSEDRLWRETTRHPTIVVGLDIPKDILDDRIAERTGAMFDRGVRQEVARAADHGLSATARHIIGLRAVLDLPRDQAIDEIILHTRRYAAYQRKWMRRIPGLQPLNADRPPADIAGEILTIIHDGEKT
jgi:tRNA dimethylallyltransferase